VRDARELRAAEGVRQATASNVHGRTQPLFMRVSYRGVGWVSSVSEVGDIGSAGRLDGKF
jgi:hypothetical protein